jgi:hypothetical protein
MKKARQSRILGEARMDVDFISDLSMKLRVGQVPDLPNRGFVDRLEGRSGTCPTRAANRIFIAMIYFVSLSYLAGLDTCRGWLALPDWFTATTV